MLPTTHIITCALSQSTINSTGNYKTTIANIVDKGPLSTIFDHSYYQQIQQISKQW